MRIQLEFSEDNVQELESLKRECGLKTWKELFSNALTLLKWARDERRAGRIIASVNEKRGRYKELCMPCLDCQESNGRPVLSDQASA